MAWRRLESRGMLAERRMRGWSLSIGLLGAGLTIGWAFAGVAFRLPAQKTVPWISAGAALVALAGLVEVLQLIRALRDQQRAAAAWRELRCERCSFDLRGSEAGRCPECGHENRKFARLVGDAGSNLLDKARREDPAPGPPPATPKPARSAGKSASPPETP